MVWRTHEIQTPPSRISVLLEGNRCQPWISEEVSYPEKGQGRLPRGGDSCSCQGKEDQKVMQHVEALETCKTRTGITIPFDERRSAAETI